MTPAPRRLISLKREEWAKDKVRELQREFKQEDMLDLLFEVGFGDCFFYDEDGKPQVKLNELQQVAFAAVLVAVLEYRRKGQP